MHSMASRTSHLVTLVRTACPLQADMPGMAAHTDGILLVDRGILPVTKPDDRGMACADVPAPRMVAAGAMAAFTLQMGKGCVRVAVLRMRSTKDNQHALVVVA